MSAVKPKSTKMGTATGNPFTKRGKANSYTAAQSSGNPKSSSGPDGSIPPLVFTVTSQGLPGAKR